MFLEYIGEHQPKGVYEVKDSKVNELLNTGAWKKIKSKSKKKKLPTEDKIEIETFDGGEILND